MNLKLKHKKLYALVVVLCLVLSLAVLLTACKKDKGDDDGTTNNGGTQTPSYTGGPEDGEYYYNVAGGEMSLVLTGGTFTIKGPGYDKSGTYTVDGTTMALDFAKDEDGTATGTIATETVTIVYNNATMTFLKKIPYTVTFNTNGGSAVAPITVVNGKSASKPADPIKDEYFFLGWYADEALTTGYAFSSPVKSNITLYAKWVKVESGPVYSVDFDLNYEGSPALAGVNTVNGLVYNLPENPTREGYTFAGWWISMVEDGKKLSYEYKEGDKFGADTTLFALWASNSAQLAAPAVNVSENGIKWTPVKDATSYRVSVKDGEGNLLNQATTTSYSFTYNFANRDAGITVFEVVAVGAGEKVSDVAVRYYNNKALDRVSGLKIVDGKLVFDAVENAEKYLLTIDCGNKLHNHDALDNGNSTYFDFANCSMQKGGIKFTVVAVAEGYASSVASKTLSYEKNLAPIASVTYDSASDSFVWSATENASAYKVVITVGTSSYTFKTSATNFSLAGYTGAISVSVTPVADGYNSPDAAAATATKTAPAAVESLAMSNTTLTWSADAESYIIKINGKEYTTTEKTYDLASKLTELNLQAGEAYTVSVIAVSGSEQSAAVSVSAVMGAMSTTLTYSNKVVSWPAVIGATGFQVRVNGGEAVTVTGKSCAAVTLTKAGENVIEVICTDLTTDWANASKITVTAYEVKYVTRTTDGGEITEYLAVGDTMTPPTDLTANGFNFGGWYNTPFGADDNGKEYTETALCVAANLTLYTNWTPKSYKVTLNVDNTFITGVTDGDTADVTYTKNYKLPVPVSTDESKGFFVGWFNAPNGGGIKMTDDLGNSVEPYGVIGDSVLYPYFAEALSYIEVKDKNDNVVGYYANKGLGITNKNVTAIVIPAMYNGKPIVGIADNAFHSCYNIVSVDFPNTVEYVGKGAFELCNKLLSINMYESVPNYETPYSTHDGALMYHHATDGKTYLEVFPSAKIGEYTVSDEVDVIGPGAFQNARVSKIIISKGVTVVSKNAFINCAQLTEIEFAYEREENVVIEDGAFADTPNVTTLRLPAKLAALENIKVFDVFEDLATIEIEAGGANYSSVDNLICDPYGTKLLYVPRSYRGTFEVPLGILQIDNKLFYENPYITKVIIGEHVESIGADAFYGCTALTELVIKTPRESVFTIGANAFRSCSNLKTVTIEGSDVTDGNENLPIYIADYAFAGCTKLRTVTIGENAVIYEIAAGSFSNCTALETFFIDPTATLKNIGDNAFMSCTALTKFEIHGTTEVVGNNAFEGCSKLNTISLGEGTNKLSLGANVFKDCVNLVTIELPASLTSFDSSLFDGCENIQNINVDANNTYLESYDGVLYTKGLTEMIYYPRTKTIADGIVDLSTEELKNLKKIGPSVFKNNPQVKTVKIGASVEEIAKNAFEGCINLTTVEFTGSNAKFSLGAYAFASCPQLTAIALPASTERIGSYAFDHSALASFTIPAATTAIGFSAFASTNLTEITIPASVTSIGHGAFYNAKQLASVSFDPRTADIAIGEWNDLDAKAEGVDVKSDAGVFAGTALTSIAIPKQATYIGKYAFKGLSNLATVTIPTDAALVTIDDYAFNGTSVSEIQLNEGLTTIGSYAFKDTKLTGVNIPKSVQYIKTYAFSIPTLTSITFTEGSNEGIGLHISNFALAGANLTSIHLPAQLKSFGEAVERYGYSAINVFYDYVPSEVYQNFVGNLNLSTITVSPDNIAYGVVDGVLYRLQGVNDPDTDTTIYQPARLLFSPVGNLGNNGTVTVPKTVTMVDYTAFIKTTLTKIIFEEYDKEDPNYGVGKLVIGYTDSQIANETNPPVITSYNIVVKNETTGRDENKTITSLTLVQFPSHLTEIRNRFLNNFNSTTAVTTIKFNPDSTVRFGAFAMRNSSAVKRIELPKVSAMEQYSFYGLSGLTELVFASEEALANSTLTDIGYRAFESCSNLTSFIVPATVKTISDMAFYGCSRLSGFTVADGSVLETIGNKVFHGIGSQIEGGIKFVIPSTVKAVGTEVFRNAKITELTLSKNIILDSGAGGSLIEGCSTIAMIHVPEDHPSLSSVDGIVYDKGKTAIYLIPSMWEATEYEIPDTVQSIAAGTFADFKGSYIKLPAALTSIGDKAFQSSKITKIEIPDNVVSIGNDAFYYCEALATITISDSSKLVNVGWRAFSHTAITEINLPDSVETIGYSAFESCSNLQSIKTPASLKSIESTTFKNCKSLTTIELNAGLEMILNNAFNNCAITSIDIPDSVARIDQYVFNGCKSLKVFYSSDSSALNFIGYACFYNCTSLETVTFGPSIKNFGYNNYNGQYNTFYGCTNLKEINLPAEMTKIPDGFFKDLQNLETITLPSKLEELGIEAFFNCPKLKTVTIPATLTTVGEAAFAKCTSLQTVVFEENSALKVIPSNMFAECTALASINLPEGIIEIGDSAFAETAFTAITLPSTLEEIGVTAFAECEKLTAINVPASVLVIGEQAFANCSELASLTLNSGLKTIGTFAFANCAKLTSVTIPDTVTAITGNPFVGCPELTLALDTNNESFKYENGVLLDKVGDTSLTTIYYSPKNSDPEYTVTTVYIAAGAFADSQLETIVLNDRITVISNSAFLNSKALKNIVIPASVTSIEDSAFMGCSALESIEIPASVKSIGNYVFANCSSLATFTLAERKDDITVGSHLFYGCSSITKTYDFPGVKEYTPYMYAGTGITSVVFADDANLNIEGVFANSALTTVTFGTMSSNMNKIGKAFFAGSKLTSITIPRAFYEVGESAFANCDELVSVTSSSLSYLNSAFEGCDKLATFTVVRPAELDSREEFNVGIYDRTFADNTSLSNTNIFEFAYQYGKEAFLNCSGITGEISFTNRLGTIGNYAFSGMTVSKITVNGREFYLQPYAFAGLTEATTVYFASATSADAIIERMGTDTWLTNATAKLEYYTPNSGDVEVTLTDEELKMLEGYTEKGIIDKSMLETVKEKMLNYKASFLTLYPAAELIKDEIAQLEAFINDCKIQMKLEEAMPLLIEYRNTLAKELTKHPKYFTADELATFDELMAKGVEDSVQNALKQAWFEYKIAYNDPKPSDTISEEETKLFQEFCKTIGLENEGIVAELINRWPEYKKQLAESLYIPVYIDLTDEELKALEQFCGNNGIKDGLEDIKQAWMLYKGELVITGKEDSEALNADEEALVNAFAATYGLDAEPKFVEELKTKLLQYKQTYAKYINESVPLTEDETKMIEELISNAGLDKTMIESIQNDLLAYKKNFYLSGFVPGKELSEDESAAYYAFMAEYGVEDAVAGKMINTFIEYRLKLAGMM